MSADETYWEYTLRPNDTIWAIAEQYTNSPDNWVEILQINKIGEGFDRKIQPGTRILIPVSMLKKKPQPARIIAVHGQVELQRADQQRITAEVGTALYSGDRLITQAQQNLTIRFADGSELQMQEHSEVVLDKLSYHGDSGMVDTRLRLPYGQVSSKVRKLKPDSRYQIQTPVAITAVRGTAFRLYSDGENSSRAEVTEGSVSLSAGTETRNIDEGFGIVAEPGKPLSEPVMLLAASEISDNQASQPGRLDVSWKTLSGAASYRLLLSSDKNFHTVLATLNTQQNSQQFTNLPAGQYHLLVRGVNAQGLQGLDAFRAFEIQAIEEETKPNQQQSVIIPSGILLLNP